MKHFVVVRAEGYMTSRPASSVFVYTKTILRCKMLVGKSQTLELHPTDAGYAFLQNALSALHRSAQPSRNVMFIGTGIASQQAEPARQIFNAVRVLAFVRTKALLAGENIP